MNLTTDQILKLGLLSAALVRQHNDLVRELIDDLRQEGVERRVLHEIILQSYLHDGYATALEGVSLLRSTWPVEPDRSIETYAEWETWRDRGEDLFRTIYGEVANRVRDGVAEASPELSSWMLHEGYGKVLARPGVDTPTRELCTVAVLVMKQRPKQLFSHLRGSLRVGVEFDLLESLFARIESSLDAAAEVTTARKQLKQLSSL